MDFNLAPESLDGVLEASNAPDVALSVIVEPTLAPKLARLAQINFRRLQVFHNNIFLLINSTVVE